MASVSKQLLIDTKTGQRGTNGKRSVSFNQRQEDFVIFAKLTGKPVKPVDLKFYTSSNGVDWKLITGASLEDDGQLFFHDIKDTMLAHFCAAYDESLLKKGSGKKEDKVADLYVEICFRDLR